MVCARSSAVGLSSYDLTYKVRDRDKERAKEIQYNKAFRL